jgi:hypothetical protein
MNAITHEHTRQQGALHEAKRQGLQHEVEHG